MNLKALARIVISLNHTKKTHNSELNLHYHIYPEDYNNHSIKTTEKKKKELYKRMKLAYEEQEPILLFPSDQK